MEKATKLTLWLAFYLRVFNVFYGFDPTPERARFHRTENLVWIMSAFQTDKWTAINM